MTAQQLTRSPRISRRALWSLGVLLGLSTLMTAAAVTQNQDLTAEFSPGEGHVFDLMVAGSDDTAWTPSPQDWEQGNPDAYVVQTGGTTNPLPFPPGTRREYRVAVRNASPELASALRLTIEDPDPQGDARDPETGSFLELFDQMRFTVLDEGTPIMSDAGSHRPGSLSYEWPRQLVSGQERTLVVLIELPEAVGNDFLSAGTRVSLRFQGVSQ
ncbi:hypothetical protein [Leucobacter sp. M11]|uniref:hypothetical protein n=1 Tax=Leucobacter sp. M11 TaxID=2993565 RepID=UPI002D805753|nr:hypothetical protein [Leucobacter sp. M11]MEB4615952.1 hypothetical protein [Leucobacter sp. M11]